MAQSELRFPEHDAHRRGPPRPPSEYRPPDWLVETVDLDVALHPTRTPVRATLALKPNPAAGAPAPLVLDGDGLTLVVAQDRRRAGLPADGYVATPDGLTIAQPPQRPFTLEIETLVDPSANTQLIGPLPLERHLLHAMRGGRLPPHHLFPRPSRRDGGLHHAHRGRQSRSAGAARQRQSGRERRPAGRPAFRGLARSVPEAVLSVRAGRRQARPASRTASSPCRAARSRCASMSSPARRTAAATRWTRSSARCAGTRRPSAANTISTSS